MWYRGAVSYSFWMWYRGCIISQGLYHILQWPNEWLIHLSEVYKHLKTCCHGKKISHKMSGFFSVCQPRDMQNWGKPWKCHVKICFLFAYRGPISYYSYQFLKWSMKWWCTFRGKLKSLAIYMVGHFTPHDLFYKHDCMTSLNYVTCLC